MSLRKKIGEKVFQDRVTQVATQICSFVGSDEKVLDLGAGTCLFTKLLKERGYRVTPVDIQNRSYYKHISSLVYDGEHLPFKSGKFDTCLLIAVLHHTPDPEVVLKEAMRVSNRLVILEETTTNIFQRYYTYIVDSFFNKDLAAPHTNKTDEEWRKLFKRLGLKLVKTTSKNNWLFIHNPMYFLERSKYARN
ncbi:MAG: class I SAM-dependent methyltransferase [bacterium]|nr:class I SAM-dependent methyltransferase [bacterium]